MVIASPTTGAETTDALTFLYLTLCALSGRASVLSALSATKKRTQPPLRPTDIRLILVIRDLLIRFRPFRLFVFFRNYFWGRMDFPHEVRFSAGIGPAHFPADLRNAALSAFEEGAPSWGRP